MPLKIRHGKMDGASYKINQVRDGGGVSNCIAPLLEILFIISSSSDLSSEAYILTVTVFFGSGHGSISVEDHMTVPHLWTT